MARATTKSQTSRGSGRATEMSVMKATTSMASQKTMTSMTRATRP